MNPEMKGGHHWIPNQVRKYLADWLSPEADDLWKRSTTGKNQDLDKHGWKTYGDIHHSTYNAEVQTDTQAHIKQLQAKGKLHGNKLSWRHAKDWLDRIKKNGAGDNTIHRFNQAVLKHLKLISLASFVLGHILNELVKAADVVSKSRNFKKAIEALRKGDVAKADDYMVNKIDSLYIDLLGEGLKQSALHLAQWWPDVRNRGLQGEFLEPGDV